VLYRYVTVVDSLRRPDAARVWPGSGNAHCELPLAHNRLGPSGWQPVESLTPTVESRLASLPVPPASECSVTAACGQLQTCWSASRSALSPPLLPPRKWVSENTRATWNLLDRSVCSTSSTLHFAGRLFSLLRSVFGLLPEVSAPYDKPSMQERAVYTAAVVAGFLFFSQLPLFGASTAGPDALAAFRTITASSRGTLMDLGIVPALLTSILLQLLAR
jgi:hypothetical protein